MSESKERKLSFFSKRRILFFYIPFISVCYIIISISSYIQKSPTFDEGIIIASGYHYLNTGKNNINPENPPLLKALLAFPSLFININKPEIKTDLEYSYNMNKELIYAGKFLYSNNAVKIINYSRFINVLLTLLAAFFVYMTITVYLKRSFGLLGFMLFLFSPNILAHARLATVDAGIMMFMFGANYFLLKGFKKKKYCYFILAGIMAGISMLCKFTGLLILPIFFIQFLIYYLFANRLNQGKNTRRMSKKRNTRSVVVRRKPCVSTNFITITRSFAQNRLVHTFKWFVLICFIALLTVNIFYSFNGCGKPLKEYTIKSSLLTHFKDNTLISSIPVLLPYDYIKGFDIVAYNNKPGFPNIYMGNYYPLGGSWWNYYLLIMGMKLPIPLLMLAVIGIIFSILILYRKWNFYFFVIPPLIVFLDFSFLAYRQSGFRYILPILPYIILCAVIGFRYLLKNTRILFRILAFVILIWFFVESYFIYPDYLTYFNQFVGGPEGAKDYYAATNLDWGQDLPGIKKWLNKNNNPAIKLIYYGHAKPSYYGITQSEKPEYIAVSVTNMYVHGKNDYISRLLATEPVANIGNSIYIFKVLSENKANN
jgi:4-amino-4-deoxy-L-arabinose transferase-like glycosyltransferase